MIVWVLDWLLAISNTFVRWVDCANWYWFQLQLKSHWKIHFFVCVVEGEGVMPTGLHVTTLFRWVGWMTAVAPRDRSSLRFNFWSFWSTVSETRGCGATRDVSCVHLGNLWAFVAFWALTRIRPWLWYATCCGLPMLLWLHKDKRFEKMFL